MTPLILLLLIPLLATTFLASGAHWKFLSLFAFTILFQNLATMILLKSGTIGIKEGILLLYIKEVILALALGVEFLRIFLTGRIAFDKTDLFCGAYLAYCIFHFLFLSTNIPLGLRVAGLRSLVILPCAYLLGRWLLRGRKADAAERFGKLYMAMALAIAGVGVVEFLILPDKIWLILGQPEYYQMKTGFEAEPGELYGNMMASFGDFSLRRAASLTGDPIMSAYFIGFGLMVITQMRPLSRVKWLLLWAGSAFCLGRSAIMTYFAGAFEIFLHRKKLIPFGWFSMLALVLLLGIPLLPIDTNIMINYLGTHYEGLANALKAVEATPIGMGIGSASNLVAALLRSIGTEDTPVIGDTFVGSLIAQIGIPGVLLFLAFNFSLATKLFNMSHWFKDQWARMAAFYRASAGFILGVTVLGCINETGYGLTASGLAFLFAGLLTTEFYARRGGGVPVENAVLP